MVALHRACPAPRGLVWSSAKSTLVVACATGSLVRLKFEVGATELVPVQRTLSHPLPDLRDLVLHGTTLLASTFRDARVFEITDDDVALELALPNPGNVIERQVAWRMVGTATGALMVHQREATQGVGSQFCGGSSYGSLGVFGVDAGQTGIVGTGLTAIGGPAPSENVSFATLPVDVAVSDGGRWAVAAAGINAVLHSIGAPIPEIVGLAGTPTAVAFRGGDLIAFIREPSGLYIVPQVGLPRLISLPGVSVASTAHTLFHKGTAADLACASCHPEGRDDGHVWKLPEGPRRTNSLLGGLKASAPFHWGGDRATMSELMDDVLVSRMSGSPQSPARSDTLLDWLDQLPALPVPDDLNLAAVGRGKVLFEAPEQQCLSCHNGPLGTNNANSDVGTDGQFQAPRLVGLASRAPYFHDGRVATLADRFRPVGGGDAHGRTAQLTPAQQADLIEYLRSR